MAIFIGKLMGFTMTFFFFLTFGFQTKPCGDGPRALEYDQPGKKNGGGFVAMGDFYQRNRPLFFSQQKKGYSMTAFFLEMDAIDKKWPIF